MDREALIAQARFDSRRGDRASADQREVAEGDERENHAACLAARRVGRRYFPKSLLKISFRPLLCWSGWALSN